MKYRKDDPRLTRTILPPKNEYDFLMTMTEDYSIITLVYTILDIDKSMPLLQSVYNVEPENLIKRLSSHISQLYNFKELYYVAFGT